MGSGTSKENDVDAFEVSDDEEKIKREGNTNREKKAETKSVSVLGKVFGKPKAEVTSNLVKARTIVNLNSSDSDEEYFQHKTDKDVELREDINSLEKTLSSLGLEERVRRVRVKESIETRESRPPAYSSDSDGYNTSSSARVAGQKRQPGKRRKDLRFSWDDRQEERKMEEWTVGKVRTEGQGKSNRKKS